MAENGKIKQPPAKMTHDALFRVLMEDPGRAATLLREYLPPALSARMVDEPPKLLDGTYVDEHSRMTQSDRLFDSNSNYGKLSLVDAFYLLFWQSDLKLARLY